MGAVDVGTFKGFTKLSKLNAIVTKNKECLASLSTLKCRLQTSVCRAVFSFYDDVCFTFNSSYSRGQNKKSDAILGNFLLGHSYAKSTSAIWAGCAYSRISPDNSNNLSCKLCIHNLLLYERTHCIKGCRRWSLVWGRIVAASFASHLASTSSWSKVHTYCRPIVIYWTTPVHIGKPSPFFLYVTHISCPLQQTKMESFEICLGPPCYISASSSLCSWCCCLEVLKWVIAVASIDIGGSRKTSERETSPSRAPLSYRVSVSRALRGRREWGRKRPASTYRGVCTCCCSFLWQNLWPQ